MKCHGCKSQTGQMPWCIGQTTCIKNCKHGLWQDYEVKSTSSSE